jgi:hypothetical protein
LGGVALMGRVAGKLKMGCALRWEGRWQVQS